MDKDNIRWFENHITRAEMSLEGQTYTKEESEIIKNILERLKQKIFLMLSFCEEK